MRVLVLTPVFPHPASPTEGLFNRQHADALRRAGAEVSVVVVKPWLPDSVARRWSRYRPLVDLPASTELDGLEVRFSRYVHVPGYRLVPWTVRSCASSLIGTVSSFGRLNFDVLQIHGSWPVGLAAPAVAREVGLPYVVTLHIQDDNRLLSRASGNGLYTGMLLRSGAVTAVGQPLCRAVSALAPDVRVEVVPNGIDVDSLLGTIAVGETSGSRSELGRVVSLCNLWPTKGIELNLRGLARLDELGVVWEKYTVIGDGPERARLEQLARELGIESRVVFAGRLDHADAIRELSKADVFSLPSWREAFGVVYLEAMACCLPVIGCLGQGAEDIIRPGVDGLLVAPRDVDDLALALRQLLEHPEVRRGMGEAGRDRARSFTWERNASRYMEIYGSVTSGNPRVL